MSLSAAEKETVIADFQTVKADTGSVEVQVALLTKDIKKLTEHFKINAKDFHSRRGLTHKVNLRRKLLKYLRRKDLGRYRELIKRLELRDIK